jgi:hypothetical protein
MAKQRTTRRQLKGGLSPDNTPMDGGKKRKSSKKGKKGKKGKKLNEFFALMIAAKKSNAPSFKYKGKTYKRKVGTKKNKSLVVYKKA